MTMRFRHDLRAFGELAEHDQELVFGRTKADSVEMAPDVKPPDSHIGLAEVADEDGEELDVYRRSVPWADAAEQGLQFVSFGRDVDRFDLQLRHIYGEVDPVAGGPPADVHHGADRILLVLPVGRGPRRDRAGRRRRRVIAGRVSRPRR